MDWLDALIVVVFVLLSIWSELRKNSSKGSDIDADLGDLNDIGNFFKKQEQGAKKDKLFASPLEDVERSNPYLGMTIDPEEELLPSYSGEYEKEYVSLVPRQRAKQQKKNRKERKSESHYGSPSDEGECLDEAPALTGKVNYERDRASLTDIDRKNKADAPQQRSRRMHKRWSRRQIVNGFLFSELFNRYDINRIYSRIPDRREL